MILYNDIILAYASVLIKLLMVNHVLRFKFRMSNLSFC